MCQLRVDFSKNVWVLIKVNNFKSEFIIIKFTIISFSLHRFCYYSLAVTG
jgi:hypothetical protein